jgi:hypothetical protein
MTLNKKVEDAVLVHDEVIEFFREKGYNGLSLLSALPLITRSCFKAANSSDNMRQRYYQTVEKLCKKK